ncbi:MAG: D-alanine--D-alanine ligase [Bacteroidia bacterium]|nr:D-alanine--D-alanine ligase [Bacteroidia bacterium]
MAKIRVGIIFGGPSREREVSFAGGRTVYDNLDKSVFEPVPLFVDSFGSMVILNWENIYKGSIRDFYPPVEFLPELPHGFQLYAEQLDSVYDPINGHTVRMAMLETIGQPIALEDLKYAIDFAFLALHGTFGEDGSIQGLLEWLGIPYSGSGILPSAIGINKSVQKKLQSRSNLFVNQFSSIKQEQWINSDTVEKHQLFQELISLLGDNMVVKPAHQGSSLGVSILKECNFEQFCEAVDLAFFKTFMDPEEFKSKPADQQIQWIKEFTDFRSGLGLPLWLNDQKVMRPDELLKLILRAEETIELRAFDSESEVLVESLIEGKEFSCIVVEKNSRDIIALPPTEIRKSGALFDYRSKYLPGLSNKVTPIEIEDAWIDKIRKACCELYRELEFEVYARIDGFISSSGDVFLNDPNTTSGMMPSSFFFHQAAEIGLNPSQFISFIIETSLRNRIEKHPNGNKHIELKQLMLDLIHNPSKNKTRKRRIAVIMGGYSFERHISMESGRNIYEKISSSEDFEALPLFLAGDSSGYELYRLPLNAMLKDNADDIRDKVLNFKPHPVLSSIQQEAEGITLKYNPSGAQFKPEKITLHELKNEVEGVFIALHGRPGEDGTLQKDLSDYGIYFNGSQSHSSEITINKYHTNQKLKQLGFLVAQQKMLSKVEFSGNPTESVEKLVAEFGLPLIAKPADDGCSAAVRKIKSVKELEDFCTLIFRDSIELDSVISARLGISIYDELPRKSELLIEQFIDKGNCERFLEVTGGMLTHINEDGTLRYEMFEPSESLAESEILSLEEKFLAGEGQNLTPSRFSKDAKEQERISNEVKGTLEKVARALDVTGYCRIDAFVKIYSDGKVETYIIEINSLPGMTPATCIYHQAAINGYKPFDFIKGILHFGQKYQQIGSAQ